MKVSVDTGSGTILGLGIILVIIELLTMCVAVGSENIEIARLNAVVDGAALAAEDAYSGLTVGYPCELADQIVQDFGAKLVECHKVGSDIYIGVSKEVLGIVHRVNARAGSSHLPVR